MHDDVAPLLQEIGEEVLRVLGSRNRPRGSTYRLQLNSQFTFRDATRLVPYLRMLGITHVYASPYLAAQKGSPHGYDVVQHDRLNPEIGTDEDYQTFVAALKEHGLGQVLDTVPNHMAASSENPWWTDVLENGPSSPFAQYFDIDWYPVKDELNGKVLLPILGDQYGQVLEAGQLLLERREGGLVLCYFDHVLPIGPKTALPILVHRIDELKGALGESDAFSEYQSILTAIEHLPPASATSPEQMAVRQREKEVIKRRLRRLESEEPIVAEFVNRNVQEFNGTPGDSRSFDRLDDLLGCQAYRLCHWRSASDEVNYRRFFDVNGLAALCVESAEVFEHSHRLVMQLLGHGDVDGLRIDHIDGLLDPSRYLWRLQWAYLAELAWRVYMQRHGLSIDAELQRSPLLAIVRDDAGVAERTAQDIAAAGAAPAPEVAGAIGAVVVEQEAAAGTSTAIEDAPPARPRWSELRPLVLRWLCDRLNLAHPDRELLKPFGEEPVDQEIADREYQRPVLNNTELPLYVVVEKILGPDEPLPDNWPVAGTSGYDFLQLLNGLLLDPQGFREVVRGYERYLGEKLVFSEVTYDCKLLILRFSMASELQMLAHRLNRISEQHRRSRDFTLNMLRHALRETLASFPVYRTYAGPAGVSERDRRFVNLAIARAKRRSPATDAAVFEFIRKTLLLEHPEELNEEGRRRRELFAGRFQQVTSPVMAKGVEDTAFYQYCPLISVNEVGSHPDVAPVSVQSFHEENAGRLRRFPTTMLGTSTHDTKRSEDVRARINILAEIPNRWRKACNLWLRLNKKFHREVDGVAAPIRNDEYLFYQTLVGFWPPEPPGEQEYAQLVDRLQAYMEKATHEAKVRTSWISPNTAYDDAVREFVGKVLQRRKDNRFLAAFEEFNASLLDWGLYTAVAQVALKILSPGVPDIYQGQELWDFSLVDPDNRRPVDYELRKRLLGELEEAVRRGTESQQSLARELANNPRDGRLKLYTTWRLLHLRRTEPELFLQGSYVPLNVEGAAARHACAFTWQFQPPGGEIQQLIVVVPRLLAQLATSGDATRSLWNAETWGDTQVDYAIPEGRRFQNLFTGEAISSSPGLSVGQLLAQFPLAVLAKI